MSEQKWIDPWGEDPPLDIRQLVLVIAHEWMKDAPQSIGSQDRIVKFLADTLTMFDQIRSQHIQYLRDELTRLKNITIEPHDNARQKLKPEEQGCK